MCLLKWSLRLLLRPQIGHSRPSGCWCHPSSCKETIRVTARVFRGSQKWEVEGGGQGGIANKPASLNAESDSGPAVRDPSDKGEPKSSPNGTESPSSHWRATSSNKRPTNLTTQRPHQHAERYNQINETKDTKRTNAT